MNYSNSSSTSPHNPATKVKSSVQKEEAPAWLVVLAKVGYSARGLIYVIIGVLAILEAFGQGGEKTDSKGAIEKLLQAPFGIFLLWVMVFGLVGYAAWRLIQAVRDTDNHGTDAKGLSVRGGLFVSAVAHTLLAVYTGSLAMHESSSSGGGSSSESWVARILGWPGGRLIVVLIGLAIIGAAIAHAVKAHKEKYRKHFRADRDKMEKLNPVCKFGLYARGCAFAIIGAMFIGAAITQNPEKAGGLREVITTISQQAYGTILLAIMGGGLLAFGLYSWVEAVYRRIQMD